MNWRHIAFQLIKRLNAPLTSVRIGLGNRNQDIMHTTEDAC